MRSSLALRSGGRRGQRGHGSRRAQAVQRQRQHQVPPSRSVPLSPLTCRERVASRDPSGRPDLLRPQDQRAAASANGPELAVRGPRREHHAGPASAVVDDASHRGEQERPESAEHDGPGEQSRTAGPSRRRGRLRGRRARRAPWRAT